jgi:hypothetical protein
MTDDLAVLARSSMRKRFAHDELFRSDDGFDLLYMAPGSLGWGPLQAGIISSICKDLAVFCSDGRTPS